MPTEMTDKALIAAIAKKLGWKKRIPDTRFPDMCVWFFEGTAYESHKLPSTDECSALADKDEDLSLVWHTGDKFWTVYYVNSLITDKSLPRAILLALLEVE